VEYWGLRVAFATVCIAIVAMIISCVVSPTPVLTPTELPPITLTLWIAATSTPLLSTILPVTATPVPVMTHTPITYIVHPGESLEDIAGDFDIEPDALQAANLNLRTQPPQIGQHLIIPRDLPTLTPQPIELVPPTCYPTLTDVILCLGYVRNNTEQAVQRVSVLIEMLEESGSKVASQSAAVEQYSIPPGMTAPYRALFYSQETPYTEMIVSLQSADPAPVTPPVTIRDEAVTRSDTEYVIEANIANPGGTALENARVVVTVYEQGDQVVGFRLVDLGEMQPGESVPMRLAVQPVTSTENLTHTLYAEGWTGD
jgi:LysM repeat protein